MFRESKGQGDLEKGKDLDLSFQGWVDPRREGI